MKCFVGILINPIIVKSRLICELGHFGSQPFNYEVNIKWKIVIIVVGVSQINTKVPCNVFKGTNYNCTSTISCEHKICFINQYVIQNVSARIRNI